MTTAICALNRVTGSLRARTEAADAAVIGDMHCAIESITEALERDYSPIEEEEAEEEEVEAEAEEEIKEEIKKLQYNIDAMFKSFAIND